MARLTDLYPSKYLKAADIKGHTPIVTIRSCVVEELGQEENKESKPVLYFEGKDKGMALNVTNANTIALILGSDDTDNWIGKKIKLVVEVVAFKGKATEAIRVKPADQSTRTTKPGKVQVLPDEDAPATDLDKADEIPF